MADLVRQETPEEKELSRKRAELAGVEEMLAERELVLATVKGELAAFERRYLRVVGRKYAELDEVWARVYEEEAKRAPADAAVQHRAKEATNAARETKKTIEQEEAELAEGGEEEEGRQEFSRSELLKRLYRD